MNKLFKKTEKKKKKRKRKTVPIISHAAKLSPYNHAFWLLWTNPLLRPDINEIETAIYQINWWAKVT